MHIFNEFHLNITIQITTGFVTVAVRQIGSVFKNKGRQPCTSKSSKACDEEM